MKYGTKVIFTSLILTAGVLTSMVYFGKDVITNLVNSNYWDEVTLGGVVEIADEEGVLEEGENNIIDENPIIEDNNIGEDEDIVDDLQTDDIADGEVIDNESSNPASDENGEENSNEETSQHNSAPTIENKEQQVISVQNANEVTIIYNANGGYFSNNELEKTVTYTKDNVTNKYVASENIQFPNKAANGDKKYMFAGRYLESGEPTNQINEWYTQDVELEAVGLGNTKTVYARWLEFEDLPIEIGGKVVATIMDRNLGAEVVADGTYYGNGNHEDYNKLGYYYQWGNNYGFKNNGDFPYTDLTNSSNNNRVNADSYGPNNYYSNSTFKKIQSNPYRWTINNNLNLWGGENPENPDTDKQGPCPAGYHVPDKGEWNALYLAFKKEITENSEYCDGFTTNEEGKCFASKLHLPFAGSRDSHSSSADYQGDDGGYWASSPFAGEFCSYSLYFDSSYVSPQNLSNRAYGVSLRCFKDSLPKTLTLSADNNQSQEIEVRWRESAKEKIISLNLSKEGKFIIGWFKDSEFNEERDFDRDIVDEDMSLYAKWVEGGIEYLKDKRMIKIYAGDKEYYIRDRNVGVDNTVDIDALTDRFRYCYSDENDCDEDELLNLTKQIGGNYYFWGISTGININNLEFDEIGKAESHIASNSIPDRLGSEFGKFGEENIGWGEGENNNPCGLNEGEYLPTFEDWLNVDRIYGGLKGYNLEYEEDENMNSYNLEVMDDEEGGYELIHTLFMHPGAMIGGDPNDLYVGMLESPFAYTWIARDDDGYVGAHVIRGGVGTKNYDDFIFKNIAMQVRCFVHLENESNNQEETTQQPSYSGGGGRVISTNSINKVSEPSGKEHNSASNNNELKEKTTQQKLSQTKLSTEGLLGRYYNNITKEDNEAYVRARDNNITTLPPEESNPNGYLKRGEMAKMVVNFALNVLGKKLPEKYPQCAWKDDVKDWDSKELKNYASKACALGLMGINTEYFNPKQEVTRAQFGTILSRMLWGNAFNIRDTKNKPYYTNHLKALKANGIMDIISNPDKTKEVRKWVWIMMKRTVKDK